MNQNPEQLARDEIDRQLLACGWVIQNKKTLNLSAGVGVTIREFQTEVGPADYVLFVNQKPTRLIEGFNRISVDFDRIACGKHITALKNLPAKSWETVRRKNC